MKKLILILSLVCIRQVKAQTYVTIPDTGFVSYLHTIVPSAMNGNQMDTSNTLVTTTTHSIITHSSFSNLFGLQYFKSLTYLV